MSRDLSWLRTLPGRPLVVAEVKSRSPYGWVNPLSVSEQLAICEEAGDITSIHTNPLWGGSWEWLAEVCRRSKKPVIAKGFHDTVYDVQRARDCGATYVLTVGWHPSGELGRHCWHEAESMDQLRNTDAHRVVWNSRNPRTGKQSWYTPEAGRAMRKGWLCQASNIRGPGDVVAGMDAILIGEGLYV